MKRKTDKDMNENFSIDIYNEYDPSKDIIFPFKGYRDWMNLHTNCRNVLFQILINHHRQDGKRKVPMLTADIEELLGISKRVAKKWLTCLAEKGAISYIDDEIKLLIMTKRAREDLEETKSKSRGKK